MPKFLLQVSLSLDGLKGTLKEGGVARRAAAEKAASSLDGTVEAYYYAFGKHDVIVIADLPDNVAAAALATTVASSGVGSVLTTVLLDPDDIDEIGKRKVKYKPPSA